LLLSDKLKQNGANENQRTLLEDLVAGLPHEKIHFFTLFIRDLCQVKLFVKPKMNSPGWLSLERAKNPLNFEVFFSIVATTFL
jgi:hypothetical protein